jgi:nicotinamide-nucleotide amidase
VAAALAEGVRQRCGATWGLGTTGVAGPDPQDGLAAGTVHVGVTGPGGADTHPLRLPGGRAEVRAATVTVALGALADRLRAPADGPRAP